MTIGQFRANGICPICAADGTGRWTCTACTQLVNTHRSLIRNLQSWHSMYESQEVADVLLGPDGNEYCLWDVERFYAERVSLADRMRQSIELCLYQNLLERSAAVQMGIKSTCPISIYATIGLTHLLARAVSGQMPGYFVVLDHPQPTLGVVSSLREKISA